MDKTPRQTPVQPVAATRGLTDVTIRYAEMVERAIEAGAYADVENQSPRRHETVTLRQVEPELPESEGPLKAPQHLKGPFELDGTHAAEFPTYTLLLDLAHRYQAAHPQASLAVAFSTICHMPENQPLVDAYHAERNAI